MWAIDAGVDVLISDDEDDYLESVLSTDSTELWMRTLVLLVLTGGGLVGQSMVRKVSRIAEQLAEHEAKLEELVEERTHELEEKNRILEELAITDPMTGLHNRRHFQAVLRSEIERYNRSQTPFSLIMMDVDYFKTINDLQGHEIGDEVLRALADLLREQVRKADTLARWGGEEFMLLAYGADTEGARHVAEKMRAACAGHDFGVEQEVTMSFGICEYEPSLDCSSLLKQADMALYLAKERGRNRTEVLPPAEASAECQS